MDSGLWGRHHESHEVECGLEVANGVEVADGPEVEDDLELGAGPEVEDGEEFGDGSEVEGGQDRRRGSRGYPSLWLRFKDEGSHAPGPDLRAL